MNRIKTNSPGFKIQRVKWKYIQKFSIPEKNRKFLWDYPEGSAPLEIYLLRLLTYGSFEDIRNLFSQFPDEVNNMVQRYPQIHRGVIFWIRHWYEAKK